MISSIVSSLTEVPDIIKIQDADGAIFLQGVDKLLLDKLVYEAARYFIRHGQQKLAGELLLKKINGEKRESHIITEFGVAERKSVMDLRKGM